MNFDDHGNLMPHQIHRIEAAEFKTEFVEKLPLSGTRSRLFHSLLGYNSDLVGLLKMPLRQWLNGSFVATKLNPEDIDVVNFVDNQAFDKNPDELMAFFTVGGSLEVWNVDAHLIPVYEETDERHENTLARIAYFQKWFGRDKVGRPKGFLEWQLSYEPGN